MFTLPGGEQVEAGHRGVVGQGEVVGMETHLVEGESEPQQVGTHGQAVPQQEAQQEEVLRLQEVTT